MWRVLLRLRRVGSEAEAMLLLQCKQGAQDREQTCCRTLCSMPLKTKLVSSAAAMRDSVFSDLGSAIILPCLQHHISLVFGAKLSVVHCYR